MDIQERIKGMDSKDERWEDQQKQMTRDRRNNGEKKEKGHAGFDWEEEKRS